MECETLEAAKHRAKTCRLLGYSFEIEAKCRRGDTRCLKGMSEQTVWNNLGWIPAKGGSNDLIKET